MIPAAAAGLVLAAGAGRRFGRPKAVVELDGQRLVDRAVRLLRDGGCAPVVVVDGAVPLDVPGTTVVHNPQWRTGMGSSLRTGLSALARLPAPGAVVVVPVDQPWLSPQAVRRLRVARTGGAFVAVATYDGRRRNPVLLAREVWDDVAALAEGDAGARVYMTQHPELITAVACDGMGRADDIDVPEDIPPQLRNR